MSKSFLAEKQEGQDVMGRTRSTRNTKPSRYTCIACGRSRSFRYHETHPHEEPSPPQGTCRRCIEKERQKEQLPHSSGIMVYEVHHYYHHACTCRHERSFESPAVELPPSPAYPVCAELPAEDYRDKSLSPHQLLERIPPPVMFWTKPSYQ